MSNPNLQQNMKEDWVESGIVMPVHMNDIGKNVNNLNKIIPVYSSTGNFYDATLENSTYVLTAKQFDDDTNNVTLTEYLDGMEIQFKIPQTNSGDCSVNVNGLGVKNIKNVNGTQLSSGTFLKDDLIKLRYNSTQNCFHVDNGGNANRQLSNLTQEAEKHFLNKTQITNCLTEIPQRIKLELNEGILTLKAGSQVIVPNGFDENSKTKFDNITIENDITVSTLNVTGQTCVFYRTDGLSFANMPISRCSSGTTPPTSPSYMYYYTDRNVVKYVSNGVDSGAVWTTPLGIITVNAGVVTSVDQVFNGIGYIGSTVFTDKGVKGLIPDGRNEDGTLKNREFETFKPFVRNLTATGYFTISMDERGFGQSVIKYNEKYNLNYYPSNNQNVSGCIVGTYTLNQGVISDFKLKTVFHALDYNDKPEISSWGMPSSKVVVLSMGVSGSSYTAPANGYVYANLLSGNVSATNPATLHLQAGHIQSIAQTPASNQGMAVYLPVRKGVQFGFTYNNVTSSGSTGNLRFIYAEGEV